MSKAQWIYFTFAIARIFQFLSKWLCHLDKLTQARVSNPNYTKQNHSCQKLAVVVEGLSNVYQLGLHDGIIHELLKEANSPSFRYSASISLVWAFRYFFPSSYCFNILFFEL